MKAKFFAVALVVCLMVGGLVLMSCGDDAEGCVGDGNCFVDWNTVNSDGTVAACDKVATDQKELVKAAECAVSKDLRNYEKFRDSDKVSKCDC